jgi:redox-sensitive bicupin YhaK (pirin superfamily)
MNSKKYTADVVLNSRSIEQLIAGRATSDGAGVKLTRLLDQSLHARLDPFLLLDAFKSDSPEDYIGGFPNHPHRGFETLTYLIAGQMRHSDNVGHQGLLETGGIQWMTAGRGIIHSEMPEQKEGDLEGFQLWINLAAKDKMIAASYLDVQSEQIPEYTTANGVEVKVIAGNSHGIDGAIQRTDTEPLVLDVHLPAGSSFAQRIPFQHNAFVYVYRGELARQSQKIPPQHLAILANETTADGLILQAERESRVLLVAGKPLHEAIVQHGPFVMNTQQQILETLADYKSGRF